MKVPFPSILRTLVTLWLATSVLGGCETPPEPSREAPIESSTSDAPSIAEQPFVELTGEHAVGVRDLFFVEENRPEPFTSDPDDRRRLLVRVWYPATVADQDEPARYVPSDTEFDGSENFAGLMHVKTRGFQDAEADSENGPYPVLIFNPGGGWTRLSDTFWTEQLASHGYVVFGVDHQGFNQSVVFPDGYRFEADQLTFPEPTGDLVADAHASWDHLDDHHFPEWLADNDSLLDRIEELAADSDGHFAGLLDTNRIGLFGWSFGGATAVQMSKDDPRVKAAVDGDGQLFGDVAVTGTNRPVLLLHSEFEMPTAADDASEEEKAEAEAQAKAMAQLIAEVEATSQSLRDNSPQVWEVTIEGSNHGSFSDLVLAGPAPPGALDAKRGHEIINALSLAFFDRTLKGKPGALLDNIEEEIPEAIEVSTP